MNRRAVLSAFAVFTTLHVVHALAQTSATDPLASWSDTATKSSIVTFVKRVTKQGSPDLVPPAERIATFDNDGTLWAEQPIYFQLAFALDRVRALAPLDGLDRCRHEERLEQDISVWKQMNVKWPHQRLITGVDFSPY
jgi:hypothetical protein